MLIWGVCSFSLLYFHIFLAEVSGCNWVSVRMSLKRGAFIFCSYMCWAQMWKYNTQGTNQITTDKMNQFHKTTRHSFSIYKDSTCCVLKPPMLLLLPFVYVQKTYTDWICLLRKWATQRCDMFNRIALSLKQHYLHLLTMWAQKCAVNDAVQPACLCRMHFPENPCNSMQHSIWNVQPPNVNLKRLVEDEKTEHGFM